ncbi:hypothetical protein [Rhodococcus triatomae]
MTSGAAAGEVVVGAAVVVVGFAVMLVRGAVVVEVDGTGSDAASPPHPATSTANTAAPAATISRIRPTPDMSSP